MKKVLPLLSMALIASVLTQACAPAPRHELTSEERVADMHWLFTQFNENYAPLDYKAERYGFEFKQLRKRYLDLAERDQTNEAFYELLFGFVTEFKDAHTGASLLSSDLPARSRVAYLGFNGMRKGEALLVTQLFPSIDPASPYPIKVLDQITHLDGVPLSEVVRKEFVRFADLGQDASNLTYHFPRMFTRVSTRNGMPTRADAVLTVIREKKTLQVTLPWVVKDLTVHLKEQADAQKARDAKAAAAGEPAKPTSPPPARLSEFNPSGMGPNPLQALLGLIPETLRATLSSLPGFKVWNTFVFVDTIPTLDSALGADLIARLAGEAPLAVSVPPVKTGIQELRKSRKVPERVLFVPEAVTYPAYVSLEKQLGVDGKPTGKSKLVGVIRLNTFSPDADEAQVLAEFRATLEAMQKIGARDILIDLIDNGGGSLSLGMSLAQALSPEKVTMPAIQFGANETWIDSFDHRSRDLSLSDPERELARRITDELIDKQARRVRLSKAYDAEQLVPFELQPNPKLESRPNLVLAVNEMCASMCDIFTAILRDNGMAKVVGSRTMGAGGNVVTIMSQAPNSKLMIQQTQSLLLRKDGSYLENNGIEPDFAMDVSVTSDQKYAPVIRKGIEVLLDTDG